MHHDDGPRILGPQLLEAVLVQALPLVLNALVAHAYAGQILGIEELGLAACADRTVRIRLDGNAQPLLERSVDHRDGQSHVAEARAVHSHAGGEGDSTQEGARSR
jgi:hypothetical protein